MCEQNTEADEVLGEATPQQLRMKVVILERKLFERHVFSICAGLAVLMALALVGLAEWIYTSTHVGAGSISAAVVYVGWNSGNEMTCYRKHHSGWVERDCPVVLASPKGTK